MLAVNINFTDISAQVKMHKHTGYRCVIILKQLRCLVIEGDIGAVAVDNQRGRIYWGDQGKHTISRAALDGSDQEVIVNAGELFKEIIRCLLGPTTFDLSSSV